MICVNCLGTGKLICCFYCGGGYKGTKSSCAYCMWTSGDELPKGYTHEKVDDDNICCMCTGSGIQRDIDPEDNHTLILFRMNAKCPKCASAYVWGHHGVYSDTEASCEVRCDKCDFSWTAKYSKKWRNRNDN